MKRSLGVTQHSGGRPSDVSKSSTAGTRKVDQWPIDKRFTGITLPRVSDTQRFLQCKSLPPGVQNVSVFVLGGGVETLSKFPSGTKVSFLLKAQEGTRKPQADDVRVLPEVPRQQRSQISASGTRSKNDDTNSARARQNNKKQADAISVGRRMSTLSTGPSRLKSHAAARSYTEPPLSRASWGSGEDRGLDYASNPRSRGAEGQSARAGPKLASNITTQPAISKTKETAAKSGTHQRPQRAYRPPLQRTKKRSDAGRTSSGHKMVHHSDQTNSPSLWIEIANLPACGSNEAPLGTRLLNLCSKALSKLPDFDADSGLKPILRCWETSSAPGRTPTQTVVAEMQNGALAASATRALHGLRFLGHSLEARVIDKPESVEDTGGM